MDVNKVMKNVEDFAKSADVKTSPRSISSYASKAIYYFPVLCSKTITDKNAFMISSNLEASYSSFVAACFAMVPAVVVKGNSVNVEDYLKKFHQNIGISDGNEYYVSLKEDAKPYLLFPNSILNEASLDNAKEILKKSGLKVGGKNEDYTENKSSSNTEKHTRTVTKTDEKGNVTKTSEEIEDTKTNNSSETKQRFISRKNFSVAEAEKKNNLKPSIVKVSCSFIIDGNEVKVDIPVGVKTMLHPVNSNELCEHIMDSVAGKGLLHNLIRYTTGEVLSLGDILFGISKIKNSVKAKGEMARWVDAIEHRKRLNKISKAGLARKPYLPNVSIVLSMDDINDIEHLIGYNLLKDSYRAVKFMKDNFLLTFAIADDATETAYILYDGHSSYDEIPYAALKRENERNSDAIAALVKSTIK